MLIISDLTYRIGARVLLSGADAVIAGGHRVGLVGRNGCGKTTLLRLIAGALEADGGRIEVPARWRIGLTSQEAPDGEASLIETVIAGDRELVALSAEADTATDGHRIADIHARLSDIGAHSAQARAGRILAGLGFDPDQQQMPCRVFSGGWRMRVGLAALLFSAPDLLLLDEPTNHLDLEATMWLEEYLRGYAGTVVIVSHDRDLLNRVPEEILHFEAGKLTLYAGNYDRFERARRSRLELNEKARAKQDAERARIQAFVDRFRYKATKAKQAQARIKMLARLEPISALQEEAEVSFDFPDPDPLPPPLMSADGVNLGYDGAAVLKDVSFRLDGDDRIALLGANGNGKSTLIKFLAGRLAPQAGRTSVSRKIRVGYFAQHQADELDLAATPLIEMGRRRRGDPEQRLRAHLGRFGFCQERAETPVSALSGGEKARLLFALMSCDKPHLLLLDEPTNHLDIMAREALIEAINGFPGAVVIVSHDPHVLALTADRLWLVDAGRVAPYEGDFDDYRRFLLTRDRGDGGSAAGERGRSEPSRKEQRRLAAQRRDALAPLKKRLAEAERAVAGLEAEKAALQRELADPALYQGDPGRPVALQTRLVQAERRLADAEEAWLTLQSEWEEAEAGLSTAAARA
ncbi:MAG: ABC-F family ATP-binding cassette domain-containing protein [Rhodospirillales bacterium]|nr:ABC-F family ATP-binding cassette domain-containing protein [Rhodospirillales bacterium]